MNSLVCVDASFIVKLLVPEADYDAYYVALAESLDCPLWTADDHLLRVMPGHASRILSLRTAIPPTADL